jgi:hypothetical protein
MPLKGSLGPADLRTLTLLAVASHQPYGRFVVDMFTRLPLRVAV